MLVELGVAEQRFRAVLEVLEGASVIEVAGWYGVVRQTVHEWLRRYAGEGGLANLVDRSSRPGSCPHQMPLVVQARVVALRVQHPGWGPARILYQLGREQVVPLPGRSSVYRALVRRGLVDPVRQRRRRAARALRLDDEERVYLLDLARAARPTSRSRRRGSEPVPPSVQRLLDSMTLSAAFVGNGRLDVIAINGLGRAMYAGMYDNPAGKPNFARYNFLDPGARDFYVDWDGAADTTVALLRAEAGRNPQDKALRELIGDLSTLSPEFRTRWAQHNVRQHHGGIKRFHHADVGPLELTYYSLQLPTSLHDVHTLTTYTAEPGSPSEERFKLLASLAASSGIAVTRRTSPDRD